MLSKYISNIIKRYSDLFYLFILIIIFKSLKLYYIGELDISLFSFTNLFIYSYLEILPLLILYPFKNKNSLLKIIYILFLISIIIINTISYIYFYQTMESIKPILFTNINIYSFIGTLKSLNIVSIVIFIAIGLSLLRNTLKNKNYIKIKYFYISNTAIILITYSLYFSMIPIYHPSGRNYNEVSKFKQIQKPALNITYINIYSAYKNFLLNKNIQIVDNKFIKYTNNEKQYLNNLGILKYSKKVNKFDILKYNRVIFVTFESLSLDFIHYYNNKIPKIASYYFDNLLNNNLHFNNFYSSNMPTQQGLNAIIRGGINLKIKDNRETMFSYFENNNYSTYMVKGISKYYGKDNKNAKYLFKAKNRINLEEIENRFGDISSNWGVHNDYTYKQALETIEDNKNKKLFMFIKTIDFHQPGMYFGNIPYPKSIINNRAFLSIYWINKQLEIFLTNLEKKNLFDDKTIIFITSDHNPHLGAEYKQYALKNNYGNLSRIPLIVLSKKTKNFNLMFLKEDQYFSQIDIMPSFILNNKIQDKRLISRDIFNNQSNYELGFYQDNFYYKNDNMNIKMNIKSCLNPITLEEKAFCKLLHNTNSIVNYKKRITNE